MKNSRSRFVALPLALYAACYLLAGFIGRVERQRCGHGPGEIVYGLFGVAAGARLPATPWLFQPARPMRFKLPFVALGGAVWCASFLFSGMFQLCW